MADVSETITVGFAYSTQEVAKLWACTRKTIEMACREGRIPGAYRPTGKRGNWKIPGRALLKAEREGMNHAADSQDE